MSEDASVNTGAVIWPQGQFKVDHAVMLLPSRTAEPLMDWCPYTLLEHERTVEVACTPHRLPKAGDTPSR